MKKFAFLLLVCFLAFCSVNSVALESAVPGKSLWGIALGSSRTEAIATAKKRFVGAKRDKPRFYEKGIVEDLWTIPIGQENDVFEVLSQYGKVIQLRAWTSGEKGQTNLSFAQLSQRHKLKKYVFGFDDPEGGGYVSFLYDDEEKGISFTSDTQEDFLLTWRPDGIIVHRPKVALIPIANGLRGKPLTGRSAMAFANEAEARKYQQKEENDY